MTGIESKKSNNISKAKLIVDDSGTVRREKYQPDLLSSEQPLQIQLTYFDPKSKQWLHKALAVVMRTPGDDQALVIGFLLTQLVVEEFEQIAEINQSEPHVVEVTLSASCQVDWAQQARLFASHSGCGVCGKSAMKQLALNCAPVVNIPHWLSADAILTMPNQLKVQQVLFEQTGGCHGAALWQNDEIKFIAEDVGRHNAVDKVIGQASQHQFTTSQCVLVLSGRISFELVQKAVVANIPVIVAVGAPSDLAVSTAKQFNISLIGFTKDNTANLYCDNDQIVFSN